MTSLPKSTLKNSRDLKFSRLDILSALKSVGIFGRFQGIYFFISGMARIEIRANVCITAIGY
jgi:hypothetical protein